MKRIVKLLIFCNNFINEKKTENRNYIFSKTTPIITVNVIVIKLIKIPIIIKLS